MYKCEICHDVSKPGQPVIRHTVYRERPKSSGLEIAREVSVCSRCSADLERIPLNRLIVERASERTGRLEWKRSQRAIRKQAERVIRAAGRPKKVSKPVQLDIPHITQHPSPAEPKRLKAFNE